MTKEGRDQRGEPRHGAEEDTGRGTEHHKRHGDEPVVAFRVLLILPGEGHDKQEPQRGKRCQEGMQRPERDRPSYAVIRA
jgi:hypothetical protein